MRQTTLSDSGFDKYRKKPRKERFLDDMDQIIPWKEPAWFFTGSGRRQGVRRTGAGDIRRQCRLHRLSRHASTVSVNIRSCGGDGSSDPRPGRCSRPAPREPKRMPTMGCAGALDPGSEPTRVFYEYLGRIFRGARPGFVGADVPAPAPIAGNGEP